MCSPSFTAITSGRDSVQQARQLKCRLVALSDGSHFHGRRSLWMRSGHGRTRCRLDPVARDPIATSNRFWVQSR